MGNHIPRENSKIKHRDRKIIHRKRCRHIREAINCAAALSLAVVLLAGRLPVTASTVEEPGAEQVEVDSEQSAEETSPSEKLDSGIPAAETYTVTVTYDESKGVIITSPEMEGGSVTVEEGEQVILEAMPREGYRVSKVVKNGEEYIYSENDWRYRDTIYEIEEHYEYEITFAGNIYQITANEPQGGSVSVERPQVVHGERTRAVITPEQGYVPESVRVNGVEATVTQINNEQMEAVLEDVTEDMYLEVSFRPMETVEFTEVFFNGQEAVRVDTERGLYVFAGDTEVVFSTEKQGIRVNGEGVWNQNTMRFRETTIVDEIQIFYQGEKDCFPVWHNVRLPGEELKIVLDQVSPTVALTPETFHGEHCYNKDVTIELRVDEPKEGAGIQSVEYWVVKDKNTETPTQSGMLFPAAEDVADKWTGTLTVNAAENNSSDVAVYVKAVDRAGNERVESVSLDIDVTAPVIRLTYDNNGDNGGNSYFDASRRATIAITERTAHFDEKAAAAGITITARDAGGREIKIDRAEMMSAWTTTEGASPDEAVHTAVITYDTDANYTFSMEYTDRAGNKSAPIDTGTSASPFQFTVDTTAPAGRIQAASEEGRVENWEELADTLTFGFWSGEKITISGTARDEISPLAGVFYYQTDAKEALTRTELEAVTGWLPFEAFSVKPNRQFTVYLKMEDMAGNTAYISTDGLIVDNVSPREETFAPEITVNAKQPVNGFYREDVRVKVQVEDPLAGGTCSGIKTVSYRVLNMGEETQSGVLYSFTGKAPGLQELRRSWSGAFVVDAEKNNSNDVVIEIFSEDNAGNTLRDSRTIKIDVTAPEIMVSYDNNRGDGGSDEEGQGGSGGNENRQRGSYYKEARIATISVRERNFDPADLKLQITNSEGIVPEVSAWRETPGGGNGDGTVHTAMIVFEVDGDYTFTMEYADLAGNPCQGVSYAAGTTNPQKFTIDRTLPVVRVSYDNNRVQNGSYFKEKRIATVTVTEHNFDPGRVVWTRSATRGGEPIPMAEAVWSSSGDTHTAVLSYETDGDYTFDIRLTDLAGNESGPADFGSSAAGKRFAVDTEIVLPVISGVEDGHAYRGEVIPYIAFSDFNFSDYEIRLTRTRMFEKDVEVTGDFIKYMKVNRQGGSGINDTFEKIRENDGIYTLYVNVMDKAGNESARSVTFSVNRFGSVYAYDDYLLSLMSGGGVYIQAVEQDFVITEYNADRLVRDSLDILITCDGKPLPEVIYRAAPVPDSNVPVGDSGWYQYQYTIAKENFAGDGVYKLSVASRDAAGNTPETISLQGGAILFRVDSTAPEITGITGLEKPIANASEVMVEYTVFDAIGLKSIQVYVDGEVYGEPVTDFSGDPNHYTGSLVLREAAASRRVRLVVEDMAGNVIDTEAADFKSAYPFYRDILVSTNFLVRWYADRPLFWGTVGGVMAVTAGVWGICAGRKRKNSQKTDGKKN